MRESRFILDMKIRCALRDSALRESLAKAFATGDGVQHNVD